MSYFVIDVEADAKTPATGSMVCFGAIKIDDELNKTFYGQTAPIADYYDEEALSISGFSREDHENFPIPSIAIHDLETWVKHVNVGGRPIFFSDNLAFDWMWIAYYFDKYHIENPFGWSGRRIGDLYCGIKRKTHAPWKKLRKTVHTHHPVDDAKGNAEVVIHMRDNMGLKIKLQ